MSDIGTSVPRLCEKCGALANACVYGHQPYVPGKWYCAEHNPLLTKPDWAPLSVRENLPGAARTYFDECGKWQERCDTLAARVQALEEALRECVEALGDLLSASDHDDLPRFRAGNAISRARSLLESKP